MKHLIIGSLLNLIINCSMGQTIAVEQSAEFPGGYSKFYEYLSKNLKYPKEARKNGVTGKVFIEFFVTETGKVDRDSLRAIPKAEIIESVGTSRVADLVEDESLEAEAIRVIRNSPKWIPGSRRGVPVKQKIVMPVNFKK